METKKKEDRKLLGSQIEDRILEYIEKKPLAVGDRLPNEFELAEMFEVGRSTIPVSYTHLTLPTTPYV